ncbi:MAG TPA: phosphodiester glycosidase family protein [Pseudobacteroides sp.]|uniref:phosphodiester glycosidase family protein n=1 Tax=Pseudobacteroides sp. TaxID=1968840 RepID=UPI002F94573A
MKKKLSKKAKIIISSVGVFLLIIGIIAYWAADRYLIEHVEIDLSEMKVPVANGDFTVSPSGDFQATPSGELQVTPSGTILITPSSTLQATASGNLKATPSVTLKTTPSSAVKATPSGIIKATPKGDNPGKKPETQQAAGPEKYTATDTSYKSDSKTIDIKKAVTGKDDDIVTYYVADIKLTDITQMKSAFAKNKFGRNIIEYTSVIAKENDAILAINGDYYGFRKDGIEIRNGMLFRNEPARTGLAFYRDGSMKIYNEKQTTGEELLKSGVWHTISFGPALVADGKMGTDIANYEVDTNFGNHPIQGVHPRAGIGMIDKNHFVFVVVDGRSKGYSKGMELEEFANVFLGLGCKTAYNLDGGYSATMYFMGNRVNKPGGKEKERGTSDIIYIK